MVIVPDQELDLFTSLEYVPSVIALPEITRELDVSYIGLSEENMQ